MDEKPRVLAVLSGKQAFAMCSRECQEAMIAKNPPGTCHAGTAPRTEDRTICGWCPAPTTPIE